MENTIDVSKKLKTELPYNVAIPLLGICSKELKSEFQRGISTPMSTAALFTTAKMYKKPKWVSINE